MQFLLEKSLKFLREQGRLLEEKDLLSILSLYQSSTKEETMSIQTSQETTTILSQELTDGALIENILAGDQQAFEILVLRYQKPLFNFLCHFLHEYDLACDALQDVFIKFYALLPTLQTNKPLKPWLFQVARNRALDELRRKHPMAFSQLEVAQEEDDISPIEIVPDTGLLPEEIAEGHELQQILRQAID